ncbi:MAG: TrkH family potassium uptake protein [Anaerovoracaceae bacterium]|jgi:trk system potassium uptake protein TrkH
MGFNRHGIIKVVCTVHIVLGFAMLPSFIIAVLGREYRAAVVFAALILLLLGVGYPVMKKASPKSPNLKIRDGVLIVALSWILASLLGTLPYLLTGAIDNFAKAFFESTSGFTTTGATILTDLEGLPMSLIFWRSLSQWLGGMGILVFAISILPALGIGGQKIARAETPGPVLDKLTPKMTDSAKILYIIYFSFTLSAFLLLLLGGMNPFDAIIQSLGSVATGGLSNHAEGIAYFDNFYVEMVLSSFTILSSINFTLYYTLIQGNWKDFIGNWELRTFLLILFLSVILIGSNLVASDVVSTPFEAFRLSLFQASSAMSTTGHFSTDFNLWPPFSKMLLLILMSIGACSASTGGGLKVIRFMVLFSLIRRGFQKRLHPRAVIPVKFHGKVIPQEVVSSIAAFFHLYLFLFILSLLVLSFENLDLLSTFSAVIATMNNCGTGLGLVGPSGSFAVFSDFSSIYLCFLMLAGRLELFTMILLFSPSFWNPDR